jgi:hypothetical protein
LPFVAGIVNLGRFHHNQSKPQLSEIQRDRGVVAPDPLLVLTDGAVEKIG